MKALTKKRWINTRVELIWNGEAYVETYREGYWYDGALALAHNTAAFDLDIYRWRDDDGSETGATWLELANTSHDFNVGAGNVDARLRVDLSESGGANGPNETITLQFAINGGGFTSLGAATTGCVYYDSTNLTDTNDTTEQLNGGGTFDGTEGQCEDGVRQANRLPANNDNEIEYTVRFVAADLNDSDSITFQLLGSDTGVITNTVTPTATITKGAATTTPKSVNATGTGTASLTRLFTFLKTLTPAGTGTASLTRLLELFKTFVIGGTGTASLSRLVEYYRTKQSTATGTASVSKKVIPAAKTMTATGTASEAHASVIGRLFAMGGAGSVLVNREQVIGWLSQATGTGTATLARAVTYYRTFQTTATGAVSRVSQVLKTAFQTTASGVVSVSKTIYKTVAIAATGTQTMTKGLLSQVTKVASAIGTVLESDVYIPFAPSTAGGKVLRHILRVILRPILRLIMRIRP